MPRDHRFRRWVRRIIRVTLAVYLGLILVLSTLQNWLIFPGAATQGRADAIVRPTPGTELVELKTSSGEKVTALFAAAAIELAAHKPVAGLMTFSAFSSMKDMARRVLPFAPTSLMLKHHFENESKIRQIRCPILIVHGTRDSIVPFAMSTRLAAA